MKKTTFLIIAVVLLLLVSIGQTIQLSGIKNKIESKSLTTTLLDTSTKTTSTTIKTTSSSGQVVVPKSLQNLPEMVGGC